MRKYVLSGLACQSKRRMKELVEGRCKEELAQRQKNAKPKANMAEMSKMPRDILAHM